MQRVMRASGWFAGCVWMGAALGCGSASLAPDVEYSDAQPIGAWLSGGTTASPTLTGATPAGAAGRPALTAGTSATAPVSSTSPAAPAAPSSAPAAIAGSAAPSGVQASAGRPAPSATAGAKAPAAGSGPPSSAGAPAAEPSGSAIASLAFQVTTSPVGLRYQPKNVGAIWIEDSSGKLVKSLKVWARTRARYLTKYSAARAGQAVDVTASATLPSHQTHSVTWDLKDRSGAAVAPGKYTLFAELTDGDATGKFTSVPFDTSGAAQVSMPPNAPSFGAMKLELK